MPEDLTPWFRYPRILVDQNTNDKIVRHAERENQNLRVTSKISKGKELSNATNSQAQNPHTHHHPTRTPPHQHPHTVKPQPEKLAILYTGFYAVKQNVSYF